MVMGYRPSSKLSRFGETHPPNLIPIMNLFLVLIPMLVTMTVVVKLSVMNLNLPSGAASEEQSEEKEKPKELENLILVLSEKKGLILLGYQEGITSSNKFTLGKDKSGILIPFENNKFNLYALEDYVKEIKEKYEIQQSISFACDDAVTYEDLIKVMDLCRRNGLSKVGLVELASIIVQ